jgi:hypothetical protein
MGHSDHSSCPLIAQGIQRPYPGSMGGRPSPLFGLAPGGVCRAFAITGEPVSSYLAISTLPAARAAGGMISVALSPDRSEPSLAATSSYGVRTFLASRVSAIRDRLIHFSPDYLCATSIPRFGHSVSQFTHLARHMKNTIRIELPQQNNHAPK